MAHLKVVVDGKTIMDADPKYVGKPPAELQPDQIRKAGKKLKPAQVVLAQLVSLFAMRGQVTTMVNFDFDDSDFDISVKHVNGEVHITSTARLEVDAKP